MPKLETLTPFFQVNTHFALRPVPVRPGRTERAVLRYGEVSTGLVKPEMAKKPAVSDAWHLSRLAGAICVVNWTYVKYPPHLKCRQRPELIFLLSTYLLDTFPSEKITSESLPDTSAEEGILRKSGIQILATRNTLRLDWRYMIIKSVYRCKISCKTVL